MTSELAREAAWFAYRDKGPEFTYRGSFEAGWEAARASLSTKEVDAVGVEEAACDLLNARNRNWSHVGYRSDLWDALRAALKAAGIPDTPKEAQ